MLPECTIHSPRMTDKHSVPCHVHPRLLATSTSTDLAHKDAGPGRVASLSVVDSLPSLFQGEWTSSYQSHPNRLMNRYESRSTPCCPGAVGARTSGPATGDPTGWPTSPRIAKLSTESSNGRPGAGRPVPVCTNRTCADG